MVFFDASALIAYLGGDEDVVEYIERHADERTVTAPLVMFEVYQGEIFKPSQTDFDELDSRLDWVTVVETNKSTARRAATVQARCREVGSPLAPRDVFITGSAASTGHRLAHRDGDFDESALEGVLEVVSI